MARPLPEPVLFLDECLGTHDVAETLRAGGIAAEVLLDHFPSGTPDEIWLPEIGKRAWVVLSKDKWIRRRKIEKEALKNAHVTAFVLTSGI